MMRKIFLSLSIMILLGACNEDDSSPSTNLQWNSLGLTGHIVNKVQVLSDKIYAATDKGFYALQRNAGNQDWELLGFENKLCQSFLIIDENEMIISLINRQEASQTGIYKTTNGGQTWTEFTNAFGGEGGAESVWDITVNPEDSSIYYAVGEYVVARSSDQGLHWEPIFGDWQGFTTGMDFVKLSPHDPQSIWVGGQNAIEQGYVLHSANGGSNWNQWFDLELISEGGQDKLYLGLYKGGIYEVVFNQ